MPIYKGSQNQGLIYKGSSVVTNVYKGSTLVYQKKLPVGTVLFEKHGVDGGGGLTTYELILPTAQTVEIVVVGGGAPVLGCAIDL